ncbi:MAG: MarR family transcriptional regulator [Methanothrix sp.]|uniref:helix-turn-helix transcriptional regulator n=1 Tax=Methanothrix sp. TaxID=90426 RepID=UPI00247E1701|nr:MarR family transcriptional regulator [Methanothrix sp.]
MLRIGGYRLSGAGLRHCSHLEEEVLALIGSNGIVQSELARLLGISSSKCSRIVCRMERRGLVKRSRTTFRGRRTYLVMMSSSQCRPIDSYLAELYVFFLVRSSRGTGNRRRSS